MRNLFIDLWRGITIILMVIYHLSWDLQFLLDFQLRLEHPLWQLFARSILISFLLLVGISWHLKSKPSATSFIFRGLRIMGWGTIITMITYLVDDQTYVRFGVLHLIGLATLCAPLFIKHPYFYLSLFLLLTIIAKIVDIPTPTPTPLLIPFGFITPDFASVDYVPILPWITIPLIGSIISKQLIHYTQQLKVSSHLSLLTWTGKHSLAIYVLHQPILLVIIWIISRLHRII